MIDPIEQDTFRFYFDQAEVDAAWEEKMKRRDEYIQEQITGPTRDFNKNLEIFYDYLIQLELLPGEHNNPLILPLYAAYQAYMTTGIDDHAQTLAKAFDAYIKGIVGHTFDCGE